MENKARVRDEWEIREDARTLARAEEIKADKARFNEAQQMAQKLANEEIARMNGMLKVAGKKQKGQSSDCGVLPRGRRNPATLGRL